MKSEIEELNKLNLTKAQYQREMEQLEKSISDMLHENLEELCKKRDKFHSDLGVLKEKKQFLEGKRDELGAGKVRLEEEMREVSEKFGGFAADEKRLEEMKWKLDSSIVEFLRAYKQTQEGFDKMPFSQESVDEFFSRLDRLSHAASMKLESTREEHTGGTKVLMEKEESCRRRHNDVLDLMKREENNLKNLQVEIKKMESEILQKKFMSSKFDEMESSKREKNKILESKKSDFNPQSLQEQLKRFEGEKNKVDADLSTLNQDLTLLNLQASLRAKIDHLRKIKLEKENNFHTKWKNNEEALTLAVGRITDISTIRSKLEKLVNKKKSEHVSSNQQLEEVRRTYNQLTGQKSVLVEQLTSLESELKKSKASISILGNKSLPEFISKIEGRIEDHKQEIVKVRSAQIIYQNFINIASKKVQCPLCEHSLEGGKLKNFISKLEETLSMVPQSLKDAEKELKKSELEKKKLDDLTPYWNNVKTLEEKEIPSLQNKILTFVEQESESSKKMQNLMESTKLLDGQEKNLSSLLLAANELNQLYGELELLSMQVLQEEEKFQQQCEDTRTVEEVVFEIEKLQARSNKLGTKMSTTFSFPQKRSQEITTLNEEISELEKKILGMRNVHEDIYLLKQNCDKLMASSKEVNESLNTLREKAKEELSKFQSAQKEREGFVSEAKKVEQEMSNEKERFSKNHTRLLTMYTSLKDLKENLASKEEIKVKTIEKKRKIEQQKTELDEKLFEIGKNLELINGTLGNTESLRRNLEDNIQFLTLKEKFQNVVVTIKELSEKVKGIGDVESLTSITELSDFIGQRLQKQGLGSTTIVSA
eukprot:TRINITY_DN8957_c0_g1_i4.p1 TRINITY_DN8957_c0_g1~~TRINITY_DN8957_c0_g1_i4.p1  ORF type:complete len:823 (+),score=290.48 TRINITY_DN8957_c0_g1_i4:73-2541(+)